jgi:hypothetical protein
MIGGILGGHQHPSSIGQALGCSNRGNVLPCGLPWRLGSFRGIKNSPGCAAIVGTVLPTLGARGDVLTQYIASTLLVLGR